ncbi:uncharacterized protein LOC126249596 [Schistocerca nitens]|uniref:uncharacterized protein LOC126249596 n=1 Tax=Schistocerca nitens TaxID=7011 RepID=UPI0021178580|nr:uncharacterized protein LOC126249596 [Schistocerca nitens]
MGAAFSRWWKGFAWQAMAWSTLYSYHPSHPSQEHHDQLIHADWQLMTRELCRKLNVGCNALETVLEHLGYCKICATCVLLDQYEARGDSFLNSIVTRDETWHHHFKPESKRQSFEWQHVNSPSKKKFESQPSAGKVMFTVFCNSQDVVLLDVLDPGETFNSACYRMTLTKLKA